MSDTIESNFCFVDKNRAILTLEGKDKIGFLQISDVIEECLVKVDYIREPILEDYIQTDRLTRIKAKEIVK